MSNRSQLIDVETLNRLNAHDASIVLLGSDMLELSEESKKILITKVAGPNWDWIDENALFIVILRVLALFYTDRDLVNGTCIGSLANRLLHSEVAIGGPYKGDRQFTPLATNAMISQLFTQLGSELPNVDSYLKSKLSASKDFRMSKGEWALFWPQHHHAHSPKYAPVILAQQPDLPQILKTMCTLDTQSHLSETHDETQPSEIITAITNDILQLNDSVQQHAFAALDSIQRVDTRNEISMISHHFLQSFIQKPKMSEPVAQLGVANYCTWIAYTIYDDFIDDEGHSDQLPIANIFHRRAINKYQSFARNSNLSNQLIVSCFDAMDTANAWELDACRYKVDNEKIYIKKLPRYHMRRVLALRAGAHVLGPTLLTHSIAAITSIQRDEIRRGLEQYLIARQLNDDLHDWKEDVMRGQISFVVAHLLRQVRARHGVHDLPTLVTTMQDYFWNHGLEELCAVILEHTQKASTHFSNSKLLAKNNPFTELTLTYIEDSVTKSLSTHRNNIDFLHSYSNAQSNSK